jgi:hypothetical protein
MLPRDRIERELAYLRSAVEKTAGPREAEAWSWLTEKVEAHFAGGHLADVAKADKG